MADIIDLKWQDQRTIYTKWWNHKLNRPVVHFSRPRVLSPQNQYQYWTASYPFDVPAETIVSDFRCFVEENECLANGYPYLFPNFGPGALCVPLGSMPHVAKDTIWYDPIPNMTIDQLKIEMTPQHPWWQRILEITRVACEKLPPCIIPAFTDIGGNLDILASLIGTEPLLMAIYDHPKHVQRCSNAITEVWLQSYRDLCKIISPWDRGFNSWAPALWAPEPTYMLQCDFSYMISPQMFEEFVKPDLIRCCDEIPCSFYHLDGPGEVPHLPILLKIKKLKGVQWGPGAGQPRALYWPDVLKKIIDAGKLVQIAVTVKEALEILDQYPGEFFSLWVDETDPDPKDLDRLLNKTI